MGLDWNPLGKPKPGYEDEFASIFQQLGESSNWGWLEKRRRRREGTDREGLHKRWVDIQITRHETVGAPQVKCYESCLASGLATLGQELRACATSYAEPKHLEHIEFVAGSDFEEKSPESKLHILYSAARCCEYWSSGGHGLEADW